MIKAFLGAIEFPKIIMKIFASFRMLIENNFLKNRINEETMTKLEMKNR